jgi:predicted NodU family carbamoyl transferase
MELFIHTSHDGSLTLCDKQEVIVHTQIDRFSKLKRLMPYPEVSLIKKLKNYNIKNIYLTGLDWNLIEVWNDLLEATLLSNGKNVFKNFNSEHHLFHSYSLNTFDYTKNQIIADGRGAKLNNNKYEYLSIFKDKKRKTYTNREKDSLGMIYEYMTNKFGFSTYGNEGKLMALSTYGKYDSKFEKIIWKDGFNYNLEKENLILDDSKNNHDAQNFCKTFQTMCEMRFRDIVKENNLKEELSLSGGFALNIINNTNLLKDFKVNVDPFNNDQGISLGAANFAKDNKIKLNTVYLGFEPIYHNVPRNFELAKVDIVDVAKILLTEPLGIFQGRSEQGQRGLGNRSLLINPLLDNAVQKMNEVKKREWYRPFAATILNNSLDKYFYDHGADGSYMLFTYKVREKYKKLLKNIISNEDNCRLQVLKECQNPIYYKLIKIFSDFTQHPIILNTSLNLPGETLTETLDDVIFTMNNSSLKYTYLPDINALLIKHD